MDIHLEGRSAKRDEGRNHIRDEASKLVTQPARGSAKGLNQNGIAGRTEKSVQLLYNRLVLRRQFQQLSSTR